MNAVCTNAHNMPAAQCFDQSANTWGDLGEGLKFEGRHRPVDEAVRGIVSEIETTLDLGSGNGKHLIETAALNPKCYAWAVDLSRGMVRAAQQRFEREDVDDRVKAAVANGYRLPFANSSFDLITLRQVLQHVENPSSVLREIRRVLKPSGSLLLQVPGPKYLAELVPFPGSHSDDPIGRFSAQELNQIIEGAGMSADIQMANFSFIFHSPRWAFRFLGRIHLFTRGNNYDTSVANALPMLAENPTWLGLLDYLRLGEMRLSGQYIYAKAIRNEL
jgi:ubiquinone/menaquinone biosynthesis C-methylase UbiE